MVRKAIAAWRLVHRSIGRPLIRTNPRPLSTSSSKRCSLGPRVGSGTSLAVMDAKSTLDVRSTLDARSTLDIRSTLDARSTLAVRSTSSLIRLKVDFASFLAALSTSAISASVRRTIQSVRVASSDPYHADASRTSGGKLICGDVVIKPSADYTDYTDSLNVLCGGRNLGKCF